VIELTRLNGEPLVVHAAQLESLDNGVDTRVTLVNGKQLYVRESAEEVIDRMRDWYRTIAGPGPLIRNRREGA